MGNIIKFRAWDKSVKKFIRKVLNNRIPTKNTLQGFRIKTRFVLTQYIGKEDREETPIYAGDYLQWSYGKGEAFEAEVVYGHHSVGRDSWGLELYTVGFFLKFYDNGICGIDFDGKYKIIGNRFQHPHLLTNPKG